MFNKLRHEKEKYELKTKYQDKINEVRDELNNDIERLHRNLDAEKRARIYAESELSEVKENFKSELKSKERELKIMKEHLEQDIQSFERKEERIEEELKEKDRLLINAKNRLKEQIEFEANKKIAEVLVKHNEKLLSTIDTLSDKQPQPAMVQYKEK